jgi:hypothetical protein
MASKETPKLKKEELYKLFIDGLGDKIEVYTDFSNPPLLIDLKQPYAQRLRVYLYNCTNPPGGRALDEYKIQIILPGQGRGCRGSLDFSDQRMPILAAYAIVGNDIRDGVFVLWDPFLHTDFAYSANMQVKSEAIMKALGEKVAESRRSNGEIILSARPQHLYEAIRYRVDIMAKNVKEMES